MFAKSTSAMLVKDLLQMQGRPMGGNVETIQN